MNNFIVNGLKLGLSGALICGVAAVFLITGGTAEVSEAEADIAVKVPVKHVAGHDFTEVVAKTGMRPRPYEVNGNEVYFAVGYTDEEPDEILAAYQKKFVASGINTREFNTIPEAKFERTVQDFVSIKDARTLEDLEKFDMDEYELDYNLAMLNGGVVPISQRPGYVAMGGMVSKEKAEKLDDVFGSWNAAQNPEAKLGGFMDGFRFIDAQKVGEKRTRVTSVWSRDKFDFEKMNDPNQEGVTPVTVTPACVGCSVGMQMKSLSPSERYRMSNMYTSQSRADVIAFYDKAMRNRGWEPTDASEAMGYVKREIGVLEGIDVLSFTKGGMESTISVFPDPSGTQTQVAVVESY
jgi:hypothetical protein